MDFYPYGGERAPYTDTCTQNLYKFEGKERDAETGNDDFGARYYSNRFGRWLSADWSNVPAPVPYANLSNPQTLNLYSMVGDDPESFADLDGHCQSIEQIEGPGGGQDRCPQETKDKNVEAGNTNAAQNNASQSTNSAFQFAKDEAIGMGKEAYNTLAGLDNWFYSGVNAVAGTNFHVEELKPATPGEASAMLGTSLALLAIPGGGETKVLSKGEKIAQLTTDAEKLYPKLAGKLQDHHVIPQYLGGAKDGATARIPAAYHQLITNEFRKLAPYGQSIQRGAAEVGRIVQEVYSKFPLP